MKKFLLLFGILSATMFAATPGKPSLEEMPMIKAHQNIEKMTPEMKKEEENYRKEMETKHLEIQKETGKDKPDWKKVHEMHKEVGDKYAEHATKMMQMKHNRN